MSLWNLHFNEISKDSDSNKDAHSIKDCTNPTDERWVYFVTGASFFELELKLSLPEGYAIQCMTFCRADEQ